MRVLQTALRNNRSLLGFSNLNNIFFLSVSLMWAVLLYHHIFFVLKFGEINFLFHCIASRIFLGELMKSKKNYKIFKNSVVLKPGKFFEGFIVYKNMQKQILLYDKRWSYSLSRTMIEQQSWTALIYFEEQRLLSVGIQDKVYCRRALLTNLANISTFYARIYKMKWWSRQQKANIRGCWNRKLLFTP